MDLTKSAIRPSVEVGASPSFDLLVSLLTFNSREGVETFDCGPEWFDEVERRMTAALRGALERLGPELSQEWGLLAGLAIQGPQAEPLDAFIDRLRAEEPIEELQLDVCEVLERWRGDVYSPDEVRTQAVLLADAEAKRAMAVTMGPEELIDAASNGLEFTPHSWIRSVVLVPHVAMRPWNVLCSHDGFFILGYPVADESLGIDATAPPPGLLRLYKALGDEKRLRMLKILARSSATLQELADGVGLAKSSAHHHLVILRSAGLVRVTTEELSRYTLRRDVIPEASALLESFIGRER
jgi:DNA-binding transcriptional ArsR family regulator